MELGMVVEFIDSQKLVCAVVMEIKRLRLRLLTENNREVKLAAGRVAHRSAASLDPGERREKLVAALKEISARRAALSRQVDIQEIWEVVGGEEEWIDLPTMTALAFSDQTDSDHSSAVLRCLFDDRLYFKFKVDRFFPYTSEQVEQITARRRKAEERERLIDAGAAWVRRLLNDQEAQPPQDADAVCEVLASYYLFEKESPHRDTARAIQKKTDAAGPGAIFSFLTTVGVWQPDENLDLLRYDIQPSFPAAVETHAHILCRDATLAFNDRRDLRHLPMITIDGSSTVDFDDALSISVTEAGIELGIHITDVGHYVTRDDPVDQAARERCSSIYMPDAKISMLPSQLADDLCSLKLGQDRPAISTLVRLTPQAKVIDYEIVPSLIRVSRQLTFHEADLLVEEDHGIQAMLAVAREYRRQRLANGALIIELPEIKVWLDGDKIPRVSAANRESLGRMLVAELMILANELAARFLADRNLPAIFRSQLEPRQRLFNDNDGSLFQNYMQRKQINRFMLGSSPEPHAGLGLAQYLTSTSPIRKYSDIVTQRQLRAAFGMQAAYTRQQIEQIIIDCAEPLRRVGRVQYRRHRYWLLKHLQTCSGQKYEALVLSKRHAGYLVLLQDYMLECPLRGAEGVTLRPEDLVQVTLQHVNARNDVLTVVLG